MRAHPLAAYSRRQVEFVDEAVPSTVFDAIAEREDQIAGRATGSAHDPGAGEWLALCDPHQSSLTGGIEGATLFRMERTRQRHEVVEPRQLRRPGHCRASSARYPG